MNLASYLSFLPMTPERLLSWATISCAPGPGDGVKIPWLLSLESLVKEYDLRL
jgi:hypothetical protein